MNGYRKLFEITKPYLMAILTAKPSTLTMSPLNLSQPLLPNPPQYFSTKKYTDVIDSMPLPLQAVLHCILLPTTSGYMMTVGKFYITYRTSQALQEAEDDPNPV